jgi:hypothetical protein
MIERGARGHPGETGRDDATELRTWRDQTLSGRVRLDGAAFVNCRFRKATLIYSGQGPLELRGCRFEESLFEFDGPAANTLAVLKAMSHPRSGLRDILKASFPQVYGH